MVDIANAPIPKNNCMKYFMFMFNNQWINRMVTSEENPGSLPLGEALTLQFPNVGEVLRVMV